MRESKKKKQLVISVMCWVMFGIFLVVAPSVFYYAYKIIVGLRFNDNRLLDYLPDILLAIVSVSCNFIYLIVDGNINTKYVTKVVLIVGTAVIGLFCWTLYFIVQFNQSLITNNTILEKMSPWILFISVVVIVINAITGCRLILSAEKGNSCGKQ